MWFIIFASGFGNTLCKVKMYDNNNNCFCYLWVTLLLFGMVGTGPGMVEQYVVSGIFTSQPENEEKL